MSSPIRVIVLCYRRWGNVDAIVKALYKYFPITVINNLPNHEYVNENAEVLNNEQNRYCMTRWIKSAIYPEPFKLVLDDGQFWRRNEKVPDEVYETCLTK